MNLCTKYNVYIMFLRYVLIGGGGGGAPGAAPGYLTLSNSPVQIGLKSPNGPQ